MTDPKSRPQDKASKRFFEWLDMHPDEVCKLQEKCEDMLAGNVRLAGPWSLRYVCMSWHTRFNVYYTEKLNKPAGSVPSSKDVLQFIYVLVIIYAKENKKLSRDRVKRGLQYLDTVLGLQHTDYIPSDRWAFSFDNVVKPMIGEGLLVQTPKFPKEPSVTIFVRRMVTALYEDAIRNGTNSWDSTLNDIASLLLLAHTGCRGGDIMGDSGYVRGNLPGLRYNDIKINVRDQSKLDAQITIRDRKNAEKTLNIVYQEVWVEWNRAGDSLMCPIKLILILAMRSGNLHFRTMEDLFSQTASSKMKFVQWRYPDRLVICASSEDGIDYDALAPEDQGNRAMENALQIMESLNEVDKSLPQVPEGSTGVLSGTPTDASENESKETPAPTPEIENRKKRRAVEQIDANDNKRRKCSKTDPKGKGKQRADEAELGDPAPSVAQQEDTDDTNLKAADSDDMFGNLDFSIDDILDHRKELSQQDAIQELLDMYPNAEFAAEGEFDQSLLDDLRGNRIKFIERFSQVGCVPVAAKTKASASTQ